MTALLHKKITVLLVLLCTTLLIMGGCLFWNYGWLTIQVDLASEQTQIFEEMRIRALQSSAADAAGCLQYIITYYPSGSKQDAGSRLDRIVEREREQAAQEIIGYLKIKTGLDLGDEPTVWIEKFVPK
jgi:hypothetical protein